MFTSILSSLTTLLPKNFIFSAYVPVLAFGFLNLALLYANFPPFRDWANPQITSPLNLTTAALFLGSVLVAYMLTTINDFLRELLEGKHLPDFISEPLRRRETNRLDAYDEEYKRAYETLRKLNSDQGSAWQKQLDTALDGNAGINTDPPNGDALEVAETKLEVLRRRLGRAQAFAFDDVATAVATMTTALQTYKIEKYPKLRERAQTLKFIIDYAQKASAELETRAFTNRQTLFGNVAEPTSMGNVAASINSYATTRYGIDLDIFWSRLQYALQKAEDKGYSAVVDAKTQLDFLVSSFWLATATTAVWWLALIAVGKSAWEFALIAALGYLACTAFYLLAVTNYLSYGEIVRAAIDLNRLTLLDALELPRPNGIRDEVAIWSGLRRLTLRGGRDFDISYKAPKKS